MANHAISSKSVLRESYLSEVLETEIGSSAVYRPSSRPPALSVCSHWPSAVLSFSALVLPAQPVVSVVTLAASALPRGVELDVPPSGVLYKSE